MNFPYEIIDLTHSLEESSPSWSGKCGFKSEVKLDYADCTTDVKFRVQQYKMHAGIGTHMDAPAHCIPDSLTIDQISLSQLVAPCVVINVSSFCGERYSVLPEDIQKFENEHAPIVEGSFVMINTGWARFWKNSRKYRNNYIFPSVSKKTAEILIEKNVCGLGIDTLSPDRPEDGFPVHQLFLSHRKYLIENATNLERLPPLGSFMMALPIKVRNATEAPIRLIGLIAKK